MARRTTSYDYEKPSPGRRIGSFFCVFAMFYLGFHAITGDHGALTLFRESRKLETMKLELADLTSQRQALEHKVKLLSSDSLDLDMLDQQARIVLGVVNKNEAVYFLDAK